METIGKITKTGVEKELYGQGFIYKDFNAFNERSQKTCYIPELSDTRYTYDDFLSIAKGFIERNDLGDDPKNIATFLFEIVDWQSPETVIEEWETSNGIIV